MKNRELIKWSNARLNQLRQERSPWMPFWSELSKLFYPFAWRDGATDDARGTTRFNQIRNEITIWARNTLSAGLFAGATPRGQPWLRLTTMSPELDEDRETKVWLEDASRLMLMVFQRSNFYSITPRVLAEEIVFGQGASVFVPDFNTVIRGFHITNGQFCIAENESGIIDTMYRVIRMSADNIVRRFGKENVTDDVKRAYEKDCGLTTMFTVIHAIERRLDRNPDKRDNLNMPYRSLYYLEGEDEQILSESGFERPPMAVPRWQTIGSETYAESPAMDIFGTAKQIQVEEKYKANAIAYQSNPPISVPDALRGKVKIFPGDINYYNSNSPTGDIRATYQVPMDINALREDIMQCENRVTRAFYVDLFRMLSDVASRANVTATEISARQAEQLRLLAPVLQRTDDEYLKPVVALTFDQLVRNNVLPPLPPALQGRALHIEFISPLFQAQRAVLANSADRLVLGLGQLYQMKPEVMDNVDADAFARVYSDALGVSPDIIVPGERVALIRQQRAEQNAAMQQQAVMSNQADIAAKLSQAQPAQ